MLKVKIERKKKINETMIAQFSNNLILKDKIKKKMSCWRVKLKKKLIKKDLKK